MKKARAHEYSFEEMQEAGIPIEFTESLKAPSPEEIVMHDIERQALWAALVTLRDDERKLIEDLYFKGRSERLTAQEYGFPRTTLYDRKLKILQKLNIFLKKDKKIPATPPQKFP